MHTDGSANLLENIESTFQARMAKLCKKSGQSLNGFADKPSHAVVAGLLKEAEPNQADRKVRPARPFGQYLPFHLTRKSDAHAIYEQMRFQDWHYFSCNSGLIRLWDHVQPGLTFSERDKAIIDTLRRDGIAISNVSEFTSGGAYRSMVEDYQRRLDAYEEWLAGLPPDERGRHKPFLDRVATAEDLPLEDSLVWNALYLNQGLAKIAAAHLGMVPRLGDVELWRSKPYEAEFQASQKWHRDQNERASVKVFLYLNDVDLDSGPLEYVLGSHYDGPRHNLLRGHNERIEDNEMGSSIPEEAICRATGVAGTLVIFDGGGLHCGSRVLSGDRRVAKMTYATNADIAPQPLLISEGLTAPPDLFMREVLGV